MKRILTLTFIVLLLIVIVLQIVSLTGSKIFSDVISVCPVNAISMANGKAVIDANKCIGCARCVLGVPNFAKPASLSSPIVNQESPPMDVPMPGSTKPVTQEPQSSSTKQAPSNNDNKQQVEQPPDPSMAKHRVQADKCIGCTLCVDDCPVNAIRMVDGRAVIDPDKCINCGICINGNGRDFTGCPVSAISSP